MSIFSLQAPGPGRGARTYPTALTAPSFVGVSAYGDTNTGTASATVPAGKTSGDILIAHCAISDGSAGATMAAPSGEGWRVLIRDENVGTFNQVGQVFWKRWGEGFTDNTAPTFTASSGTASVVISVWRGCDTDPVGVLELGSSNGTTTTLTAPAVTALTATCTVVRLFNARFTGSLSALSEGSTMYSGASYSTVTGPDRAMAGSYLTNIGATSTGTATATGGGNWTTFTIVLEPNQNSWTPMANIPLAWFDAGNSVILVSGAVNRWGDKTGRGFDLTTGVSPTYSTTAWNGNRPGMVFTGNQVLTNTSAGFGKYVQGTNVPFTIFATVKYTLGAFSTLLEWGDAAITTICSARVDSTGHADVDKFSLGTAIGTNVIANLNKRICITSTGSGNIFCYADGSLEINNVSLSGTLTTIDRILVGNNWNVANPCGTIAEFVVYTYDNTVNYDNYRWYSAGKFG